MSDTTSYVPYDYRRLCDVCGELRNRSQLRKLIDIWVCDDHPNERRPQTLDKLNAAQKPFRILPVPEGKPLKPLGPDVFYDQESEVFALLDLAQPSGARYLQVIAGQPSPLVSASDVIPVNSWACLYYYALANPTWNVGLVNEFLEEAKARLRTCADALLALQSVTGTRATNAFYGGFLASGAAGYYTEDAITSGLSMLYAYCTLGDLKYLYAARAAASYLRNVQAIGSNGVNFTSTDSAGTSRLYTGGLANFVSTSNGFFSDHLFYLSSLMALQFWNELKATDGDQQLGATAAIASNFTTAPNQLLSLCVSDLRNCFANGIYDATHQDVRTGLSGTTPSEFFNAFPAAKPHTSVTGSGSWEYFDGISNNGTVVTSQNFAKALSGLYAVDGLSAQVKAVDDWMQTFTSNSAYETPANTAPQVLARSTTGVYDPSVAPAQYLMVRDASNSYAATAKNGGSLYDWGAFGLMAPLWSSRRANAFNTARDAAITQRRRLNDGLPSDGDWLDYGFYRGRQGLSMQTYFFETISHGPGGGPSPAQVVTTPPANNMILWFKSDVGVTVDGSNQVLQWNDQGPNHWNVKSQNIFGTQIDGPTYVPNKINGLPGIYYFDNGPSTQVGKLNYFAGNHLNLIPIATDAPRTILALAMRDNTYGGIIFTARQTGGDHEYGLWNNSQPELYSFVSSGNGTLLDDPDQHVNQAFIETWQWFGIFNTPPIAITINGTNKTYTYSGTGHVKNGLDYDDGTDGFSIGNVTSVGDSRGFSGWITEVIMYGGTDPATLTQARAYLQHRQGVYQSLMVYDAVAAAQFAAAIHLAPRAPS